MTKPGHLVVQGDVLTIVLGQRVLVMRAIGFAERRGSYPQARQLYDDLSEAQNAPAQKGDASESGNC
jgi:ribosome-associated heat shock protein Hsp15